MNIRKFVYSLAIVMLSYDVLSTLIASKLYGRFADLSPIYNFLGQKSPTYFCILMAIVIASLIFSFLVALGFRLTTKLVRKAKFLYSASF